MVALIENPAKYDVRSVIRLSQKGLSHVEFLPRGETIHSDAYCETTLVPYSEQETWDVVD